VCRLAWEGDRRVSFRTQASIAVSADHEQWILLNAAPDLRAQIAATPTLRPREVPRGSPITAVVLTGAEVDQVAGLLSLREREPFTIHATAEVLALLAANPMFDVLAPDMVTRKAVTPGKAFPLPGGIRATLFPVPGKAPLYLEGADPETAVETATNVGVELELGSTRLAYVPGCASVTPALKDRLRNSAVVLFDGTLYTDDEMIRSGTGAKTGRRMGHMPIAGADGSLAALAGLTGRRIYIHINNTNPILIEGSPERRAVEQAGWEIAVDGLKIVL
jgi:pyrroloquinoline quinone biosynthesis protein B